MSEPQSALPRDQAPLPPQPGRTVRPSFFAKNRTWLNILLFLITLVSAYIVGVSWSLSYIHAEEFSLDPNFMPGPEALRSPRLILLSAVYAGALILILLAHEMGHYLTCRRYGLDATLPFFVPAPTLVGTIGAFIKIRSPVRQKHQLFDIGAAGPLAGFVLALPAVIFGLAHSKIVKSFSGPDTLSFGEPLLFRLVGPLFFPQAPADSALVLHPVAFAGWVGLLVTAFNLFPVGQLDGGHIAHAAFGARTRSWSRVILLVFLVLGLFFWLGWIVWAALLLLLGLKHPPVYDEARPLSSGRKALALIILLVFALSFIPDPVQGYSGLDMIKYWLR